MTCCKFELGKDNDKVDNSSITVSSSEKALPVDPVIPYQAGVHYFGNSTRFLVLLVSTLCLSLIMGNSLILNITILCMFKEEKSNPLISNSLSSPGLTINSSILNISNISSITTTNTPQFSKNGEERRTNVSLFTDNEKHLLISATAIGSLIGTIPITFLTTKFGVRNTFTAYGLLSALSTFLTPFCALLGFFPVFLMRTFQGFALATGYPAMGSIISKWSTLKNSGISVAFLSCHLQFGPIFTMPVAGVCCSRFGWEIAYFLQGILTFLAFGGFYIFFRDSPQLHKNVSHKELHKIQQGRNIINEEDSKKIPYKAIFLDMVVWGIIAINLGGTLGFQIFMQYGAIYLKDVLKFDVQNTGFSNALPYLLSACVKFVVGPFSDYFTFITVKSRVLLFASLSQFIMAGCFIALNFIPSNYMILIQICFTLATVSSGLNCVGVAKATQLISGQYAHVMMAICSFVASLVVLIIPSMVNFLAPYSTNKEWGKIFLLIATIVVITTLIFVYTAEVEPRSWTYSQKKSTNKEPIDFESSLSKDISIKQFHDSKETAKPIFK